MQTVSAGEFKAHCLKLMDKVSKSHEELIVTKRGVPLVKMVPVETQVDPFGFMKGTITINCDLATYALDEAWDADKA